MQQIQQTNTQQLKQNIHIVETQLLAQLQNQNNPHIQVQILQHLDNQIKQQKQIIKQNQQNNQQFQQQSKQEFVLEQAKTFTSQQTKNIDKTDNQNQDLININDDLLVEPVQVQQKQQLQAKEVQQIQVKQIQQLQASIEQQKQINQCQQQVIQQLPQQYKPTKILQINQVETQNQDQFKLPNSCQQVKLLQKKVDVQEFNQLHQQIIQQVNLNQESQIGRQQECSQNQLQQNVQIEQQKPKQQYLNLPYQQNSPTLLNRKQTTALISSKKLKNQLFVKMLEDQIGCIDDLELRIVVNMSKKVDIAGRLIVTTYRILFLQQPISSNNQSQFQSQKLVSQTIPQQNQYKQSISQKVVKMPQQQKQNQIEFENSLKKKVFNKLFCFPIGYIYKCQRSLDQSTGLSYLQLILKTGLNIKIRYPPNKYSSSNKANQIILNLMNKNVFVALDQGKSKEEDKLCQKYNLDVNIEGLEGAYYYDNFQWNQMISYPEKFVVPLPYIGKRKTQFRLVILSTIYKLKQDKIGLWRTGPGNPDPSEDQWVPKAKHTKKHLAIQIKNKGIGTSKSLAARTFQLQNLTLLKDSFQKMHGFSYHGNQPTKWISNMINSKWYQQVALLIQQAFVVIDLITEGTHVTLLSDTQSRGAQISAIVQILLTAQYRTLDGFSKLVQKQFLHYGVQKPTKKQKDEDKGIIFIQFLDCVYQLCNIYPLSFEFSKNLLVFIAEHVYSGKYGNFLYITKAIKQTKKSQTLRCACIWKDIKNKIQKSKLNYCCPQDSDQKDSQDYCNYFRNCFFIDPKESDIIQLRSHIQISKSIKFWTQYFCKKTYCLELLQEYSQSRDPIQLRYHNISKSFNRMKRQNQILKKKLGDQHKSIVQQKTILKELNEI